MLDHFRMFADYNRWANRLIYAAAAQLTDAELRESRGAFFGSLLATLNHILVADRVWMRRFTQEGDAPSALDALLHDDLPGLAAARATEDARIIAWVGSLDDERLGAKLTYTPLTNPMVITQKLGPVLAHFFNHQTHHRGQAHATLTALGHPSLALDLVYFLRTDGSQWA
ncbi:MULTISPECIES: DinB family protein [unclassified Ensifer]|uniref:DinB family protein n=1 Tax=unclassified Ensifer TaxID=2633371 RepID=UPI00081305DB|nr:MULTISPECIES: DinB family protein [unclassified Ensifer]OCP01384.1 diguanylate cyclase [Ensifer sp. LC14]OCP03275.1 diguanylate cyclase [Ensifer sp. LC11]OCP03646.1 diguanylate cyclase [Ensifer sp. LC13]OCP34059.1 diguanylate cyclase [Ensifer sp. LC499]